MSKLGEQWRDWRNRIIGTPGFQQWAMRSPFGRPAARRNARRLFDLTAGFVYAQVAAALVESGLLEALAERALTVDEAAQAAELPREGALTLLKAAGSLRLVDEVGERWRLGADGAALRTVPGLREMIGHHRLFYEDVADPLAMLRKPGGGRLASLWRYDSDADPEAVASYSRFMAATQPMVAAQALAAYRFDRHSAVLDLGGGEGAFLRAIHEEHGELQLGLFDLPQVVERARAELAAISGRVAFHAGSMLADALPGGYDLHTLVRVLHDHDDEPAAAIMRACFGALPPGGRLLIVEPMAGKHEPAGHGYFGFYLTAMGSGRPRSPREIGSMLTAAGFVRVRELRTPVPLIARCLVAQKA